MVRWVKTEARFWDMIWEREWREDLEDLSCSCSVGLCRMLRRKSICGREGSL